LLPLELPLEVRLPLLSPIQRAMALCQVINGTCAGVPFVFGRRGERRCHGLDMRMPFTHAVFAFVGWAITVRGNHVYDRLSGPRHRLDVSISAAGDAARRDLPHGALGHAILLCTAATYAHALSDEPNASTFPPAQACLANPSPATASATASATSTPQPVASPRAPWRRVPSKELPPCTRWPRRTRQTLPSPGSMPSHSRPMPSHSSRPHRGRQCRWTPRPSRIDAQHITRWSLVRADARRRCVGRHCTARGRGAHRATARAAIQHPLRRGG